MSYRAILIGLLHFAGRLSLLVSVAFFVTAVLMPEMVDLLAFTFLFFTLAVLTHLFSARGFADECERIGRNRLQQSAFVILSDFLLTLSTVIIVLFLVGPEFDIPERYLKYAEGTLAVAFFLHFCPLVRLKKSSRP